MDESLKRFVTIG